MSKSFYTPHSVGIVGIIEIIAACALTVILLALSAGLSHQRMQLNVTNKLASERQEAMNLLQQARAAGHIPNSAKLPMEAEVVGEGLIHIWVHLSNGATLSTLVDEGQTP